MLKCNSVRRGAKWHEVALIDWNGRVIRIVDDIPNSLRDPGLQGPSEAEEGKGGLTVLGSTGLKLEEKVFHVPDSGASPCSMQVESPM